MDAKYNDIIESWKGRIALNLVGFCVWLAASIALLAVGVRRGCFPQLRRLTAS